MTAVELGYLSQGWQPPEGMSWEQIDHERAKYGILEIYVPIACAPGCVAWGVPMADGKFLKHD